MSVCGETAKGMVQETALPRNMPLQEKHKAALSHNTPRQEKHTAQPTALPHNEALQAKHIAADTSILTLPQVVNMARSGSIAAKQASTVRKTKYWEWRTYRSNYQPQLALTGTLPGFMKTTTPVTQPNGTVKFEPIHNNNSTLNLAFSQSITATGGQIIARWERHHVCI